MNWTGKNRPERKKPRHRREGGNLSVQSGCSSYKTDKDGLIVKRKPKLVANGFSQVQAVDYFQTFEPTP